jgi:hypothetical protein
MGTGTVSSSYHCSQCRPSLRRYPKFNLTHLQKRRDRDRDSNRTHKNVDSTWSVQNRTKLKLRYCCRPRPMDHGPSKATRKSNDECLNEKSNIPGCGESDYTRMARMVGRYPSWPRTLSNIPYQLARPPNGLRSILSIDSRALSPI